MRNKWDTITAELSYSRTDVVAISETWLQAVDNITSYSLPGYVSFASFRSSRAGGGTSLYVNQLLKPIALDINQAAFTNDTFNISAALLTVLPQPVAIVACYLAPWASSSDAKAFVDCLQGITSGRRSCLVVGDFNLPHVCWTDSSQTANEYKNVCFQSFVDSANLQQLIAEPTRGKSILDLVLVSPGISVTSVGLMPPIGLSDHAAQYVEIAVREKKYVSTNGSTTNFFNVDTTKALSLLNQLDWVIEFRDASDVDDYLDIFMSRLYSILRQCNSTSQRSSSRRQILFPKHILRLVNKKKKAWKNKSKVNGVVNHKDLCKKLRAAIHSFHAEAEINLSSNGNRRHFFNYVNNRLGRANNGSITLKSRTGDVLSEAVSISEAFSEEFAKNFSNVEISSTFPAGSEGGLRFNCNLSDVKKYILAAPNSAAGSDGISGSLLVKLAPAICFPLGIIFQHSIAQAKFPTAWKNAIIQPLFKGKGDATSPSSYRPISLCSVMGKALERLVKDQLMDHLASRSPLSRSQHGFLHKRSTITNLLACDAMIADWINNSLNFDVITFDFCRAFDKVPHATLLDILSSKDLHQSSLLWISSFLTGRHQSVRVESHVSQPKNVSSGVIQGSALGPALFLPYIDSLLCKLSKQSSAFADDLKVLELVQSVPAASSSNDVNAVAEWSCEFSMPLSVEKCYVMHCGPSNPKRNYTCNGVTLPSASEISDLGVIRSNLAPYTSQAAKASAKASKMSGLILAAFRCHESRVLWPAFKAYVLPLLRYASVAWCPRLHRDIDCLERVQKRFTKKCGDIRHLSYDYRLKSLKSLSVKNLRLYDDMVFTYKVIHGNVDMSLSELGLSLVNNSLNTRGQGCRLIPGKLSLERAAQLYKFRAPKEWNALPSSIISSKSLNLFKINLKHWLIEK